MKTNLVLVLASLSLALLAGSGCVRTQKSTRGFVFPEGNIARGKAAFVALNCYECHSVHGVKDLPDPNVVPYKVVVLGGDVQAVKTYGDLLTAVIHPSLAKTAKAPGRTVEDDPMPNVNDVMTVQQMLDLVTFLSPQYVKLQPLYQDYY